MEKQLTLNFNVSSGRKEEPQPITVIKRRHQRTMRIRIRDDAIVVSGPSSVSNERLLRFVEEKRDWIRNALNRKRERAEVLERKRQLARGTLLLRGERKPIYDFPVPGLSKPALIEREHAVVCRCNPLEPGGADSEHITLFCRNLAKVELRNRFDYWTERIPFQPSRLTIRNQRTKWGSCSARGTISLNWRLIKCPPTIVDYIIIHELCHLKHLNHSRAFWDTVLRYYPDIGKAKKWIRENSEEVFGDF